MKALTKTDFNFPGQKSVYHGKVRDVYNINGEKLVMVATDRISAFDVVLPKGIPFKGQMLNQIAAKFLDATTDICPNWKTATPDPMVTVGVMCEGFPIEMIVRGYLCGSAWRTYKSGVREICGVKLPEGMKENQKFPEPIITPTTKAEIGADVGTVSGCIDQVDNLAGTGFQPHPFRKFFRIGKRIQNIRNDAPVLIAAGILDQRVPACRISQKNRIQHMRSLNAENVPADADAVIFPDGNAIETRNIIFGSQRAFKVSFPAIPAETGGIGDLFRIRRGKA